MKRGREVFVDSGAWIALALTRDRLSLRAVDTWHRMLGRRLSDPAQPDINLMAAANGQGDGDY